MKGVVYMADFTPELLNKLEGFFVNSIAEKVLDGVTYIMIFNTEQKWFELYNKIREDIDKLGYDKNTLFRVYQFSNGYVFDLDLSVSIYLADKIMNSTIDLQNNPDLKVSLSDEITKKRKGAMVSLAKYCKSQIEKGNQKFDIALYSRNTVPKILVSCKDNNNNAIILNYKAFALRHWDLDIVSNEILLPIGIRISKVEPCEILPSRNGVRMTLYLEPVI